LEFGALVPRYGKFESISLQQRVSCEPAFLDQGAENLPSATARRATAASAVERVERAGKVIHGFIVAAAKDSREVAAADSRFTTIFRATSMPAQDRDAFPSCAVVIKQFDRLERHHEEEAGMRRETRVARPTF
jgi:hypothetical protein